MAAIPTDKRKQLRIAIYAIMVVLALGGVVGRIWKVDNGLSGRESTPFLSANDRSRWCTIRALVDRGTYVIDHVILQDPTERDEDRHEFIRAWHTIDLVRHIGDDGREHYYSSKPPLLPTLLAGQYWLIKKTTGAEFVEQPHYIARTMLCLTNGGLMLVMLLLLALLVEEYGASDWAKIFVMACGCFATLLTPFAVTLNNHLPAAAAVMIACWASLAIWRKEASFWHFLLAGIFAAFAAANELPALAFLAAITVAVFWKDAKSASLFYLPGAALVIGAFFFTTLIAHDSWRPPYMHRKDGDVVAEFNLADDQLLHQGEIPEVLSKAIRDNTGEALSDSAQVEVREGFLQDDQWRDRWTLFDRNFGNKTDIGPNAAPRVSARFAIVERENQLFEIRQWDNWYEYSASYWQEGSKRGVDKGEEQRVAYAFHTLIGHHGVFSLTPVWILSAMGIYMLLMNSKTRLRPFAVMVLLISLVVIGFYIARPEKDRNYGGMSCGMRWLLWLAPMWLICMLPAANAMRKSRWGIIAALGMLAGSIISVAYSAMSPWSHPWLYQYLMYLDPDTYQ